MSNSRDRRLTLADRIGYAFLFALLVVWAFLEGGR